jgi:hypothetical protein
MLLAVALIASALTATAHAEDTREVEARKAYAAGRYKEAIDMYSNLYASTLHPTYLRNIGRCYQNLQEPQLAITSYQEYLRKANVTPAERSEVEGFIAQMEALKKQRAVAAPPAPTSVVPASPPPAVPPPAAPSSAVVATPSPSLARSTSSSVDLAARAPEPEAPSTPFYTRWWFWTLVGLAAAGGGAAVYLTRSGAGDGPSTDYGPYSPTWQ